MAAVYGIRGDNKCKHEVVPIEDFNNMSEKVTTAQGNISDLQQAMSTANQNISTAQQNITNLSGNKFDKANLVTVKFDAPTLPSGRKTVLLPSQLRNKGIGGLVPVDISAVVKTAYGSEFIPVSSNSNFIGLVTNARVTNYTGGSHFDLDYTLADTVQAATFYVTFLVTNIYNA